MGYQFDFGAFLPYWDVLLRGLWLTIQLTVAAIVGGVAVGIAGAAARTSKIPVLRAAVGAYVELIRNTPFLVQLFFIFFGLPELGIQLSETQAAFITMIVNLGAYSTEIIRAGIEAIPKGQTEAGLSLALSRLQVFRYIVILPALQKIWPALASQIIIVMLGSSVVSQISAEELTFAANFIQSRNFRAFEAYFIVTAVYLLLAIGLRAVLQMVGARLFARR